MGTTKFIVSWIGMERAGAADALFLSDPFLQHVLEAKHLEGRYAGVEIAPSLRETPLALKADNDLVWGKYQRYLPLLAECLNEMHHVSYPAEFWRRALSMGIIRHITMVYDLFKTCERYFDPEKHQADMLDPDVFYIPVNYDEHRWFFQHSHFGQEQLFSLYMRVFHHGTSRTFIERYSSQYVIPTFAANTNADPVVGIMRSLFTGTALQTLRTRSNGNVDAIGFTGAFPVSPRIRVDMRQNISINEPWFDRFDTFFFRTLPILLPREFVEDFAAVVAMMSAQLSNYRRLTHVVSETFIGESYESIALALLHLRGVKTMYNEHNYSEYPFLSSILHQQTSFTDLFAAHGNYAVPIAGHIAAGSLFEFSVDNPIRHVRASSSILYVSGIGLAKYSNFSHSFGETADHARYYYMHKVRFFEALPDHVIGQFLYRAYPVDAYSKDWGLKYDDSVYMQPFLGRMTVDDFSMPNKERMLEAKLVIIDYLSTSHFESMSMNIPTVILLRPESYCLSDAHKDFFAPLIEAGICHTDMLAAAAFIGRIEADPALWWMRPDVQKAKDAFLATNLGRPECLTDLLLSLAKDSGMKNDGPAKTALREFVADENRVYTSPTKREAFRYSDGEASENTVFTILNAVKDLSTGSEELKGKISDWVTEYHFSQERHNLLRHINWHKNLRVLELGCGCGAITRQLGESGARVTALEGSYHRAKCAAARCRDLQNVSVYATNFQDVRFTEKYDVVTLIGVLEYSPLYFTSADPIAECLRIACDALTPDGVLIIAIENRLGLKYFSGFSEDHVDIPFFGIEDRYHAKTAVTFGRKELSVLLAAAGFGNVEFQYPFPDYKIPKVVFTHGAFGTESFQSENIITQLKTRDYSDKEHVTFRPELAAPSICRNNLMEDLSNSFLVIASKHEIPAADLCERDVIGVFYTTERNRTYNLKTSFVRSGTEIRVRKEYLYDGPAPQTSNALLIHDLRDSMYVAGKNLAAEYTRCMLMEDADTFSRLFTLQLEYMRREAIRTVNPGDITASEINADFIDCVPSNLILRADGFTLIDREWNVTRPVSFGTLLLRSVDAIIALGGQQADRWKERMDSMLRTQGFVITEAIRREYAELIAGMVSQVYARSRETRTADTAHQDVVGEMLVSTLESIKSEQRKYAVPIPLFVRLTSHIDEMFRIRNGERSRNYYATVDRVGLPQEQEIAVCEKLEQIVSGAPEWSAAHVFMVDLIAHLKSPR